MAINSPLPTPIFILTIVFAQVGMPEGSLPPALTPELLEDSSFLQALHRVLMDMHVVEGALICPETGRRFPIAEGVPNLM